VTEFGGRSYSSLRLWWEWRGWEEEGEGALSPQLAKLSASKFVF
jgi:hypothetical protein